MQEVLGRVFGSLKTPLQRGIAWLSKLLGIELVEVSVVEKLVAAIGGGLAILFLIGISTSATSPSITVSVVGSMGASAVLLFAVPHGQLSQPWPVIGGQFISAIIGVACARSIPHPALASACAVGFSIGVMYQLKCIHPPGGATAFTAVMNADALADLGFSFAFYPVLLNSLTMVLLAMAINLAFKWRRYPASLSMRHRQSVNSEAEARRHQEILVALRSIDSFVDVTEDDLVYLAEVLAKQAVR